MTMDKKLLRLIETHSYHMYSMIEKCMGDLCVCRKVVLPLPTMGFSGILLMNYRGIVFVRELV